MKNKNTIHSLFLLLALALTSHGGGDEQITALLKVVDEKGRPVEGARITPFQETKTLTNKVGEAKVTFKKQLGITYGAMKEGYHRSNVLMLHYYTKDFKSSQPFLLTLKKKINPIPMYVKSVSAGISPGAKIPGEIGDKVGYDLQVGDWVKPYGKGVIGDMIFQKKGDFNYPLPDIYKQEISVTFANKKDGIIPFEVGLPRHRNTKLMSAYKAPLEGYLNSWQQTIAKNESGELISNRKRERNYYLRVRTKVDESGKIVSAHYGKIYGDFMSFYYYFNPSLNDRNIEFDTSKNLFKGEYIVYP